MGTRPTFGVVASNTIPLGTKIKLVRPKRINGRKYFRVEDTGGPGFLVDVYAPSCGWAIQYGRRTITIKTVPKYRKITKEKWTPLRNHR